MGTFIRRIGGADLNENKYFNERIYVGKNSYYKNNPNKQCTHYAIGRTSEIAEVPCFYWKGTSEREDIENPIFNDYGYHDAKEWFKDALWDKTEKADEVKLGDIVIYGSNWGSGHGHVRIIESIEDDCFICSGGNEDGKGTPKFDIKVEKKNGNSNGKGLLGYIHNPLIETADKDYKKLYEEAQLKLDKINKVLRG